MVEERPYLGKPHQHTNAKKGVKGKKESWGNQALKNKINKGEKGPKKSTGESLGLNERTKRKEFGSTPKEKARKKTEKKGGLQGRGLDGGGLGGGRGICLFKIRRTGSGMSHAQVGGNCGEGRENLGWTSQKSGIKEKGAFSVGVKET